THLVMTAGRVDTGTGTLVVASDVTANAPAVAESAIITGQMQLVNADTTFNVASTNFTGFSDNLRIDAVLGGDGGIQKLGPGRMVLTAANVCTGRTQVGRGTLDLRTSGGGNG